MGKNRITKDRKEFVVFHENSSIDYQAKKLKKHTTKPENIYFVLICIQKWI